MKGYAFIAKLGRMFPKSISDKYYDFVGLSTGKIPQEINKILIALDYDEEVHEIAKQYHPDLVLTHHPFFYGSKNYVLNKYPFKRNLYEDINKEGISIFSLHTNFDEAKGGMNDALVKALNLQDVYCAKEYPMMRIGYLANEMEVKEFAKYAKKCLKVNYGLLINTGKDMVKKVAIIGGGAGEDYQYAIDEGCDIFVSGDASHHVRREIISSKFNYLDLPHEIEKIFIPTMKNIINDIDSNIDVLCVDHEKEPLVI